MNKLLLILSLVLLAIIAVSGTYFLSHHTSLDHILPSDTIHEQTISLYYSLENSSRIFVREDGSSKIEEVPYAYISFK